MSEAEKTEQESSNAGPAPEQPMNRAERRAIEHKKKSGGKPPASAVAVGSPPHTWLKEAAICNRGCREQATSSRDAACCLMTMDATEIASQAGAAETLRVCQVGYCEDGAKIGLLTAEPSGPVTVRDSGTGAAVYECAASRGAPDADSGDTIYDVDFSGLSAPGRYYLDAPGLGRSFEFEISANPFGPAYRLAMRTFYGLRCGIDVDLGPDFPQYRHAACHTKPATFHASSGKTGTKLSGGGWHDAGDYGRYIVNSGLTTATLLWAFDLYRDRIGSICLDIPESGSGVPDLLSEIHYNIDWMLSMQDDDGGVWHKATSAIFCGFIMPEDDEMPVLIVGSGVDPYKTTGATADFAAVCARASRTFAPYDPQFGARCLRAARAAWAWLAAHPEDYRFRNPDGIRTGEYGDGDLRDERLWAAAELFAATGERQFGDAFERSWRDVCPMIDPDAPQAWPHVGHMALYAYMFADAADESIRAELRSSAVRAADVLVHRTAANGYRTPMRPRNYIWGSNSVVANYGMMLLFGDRIAPDARRRDAAMDCLHYLLGRNPLNLSYVTQVGARWPMHPHHRPSSADGIEQPWPGMLVGGPNARGAQEPAKQWLDDVGRYDLNEIAINWNAPLVFQLAAAIPSPAAH